MARQKYTPEEAKAFTRDLAEQADRKVCDMLNSDGWREYVAVAARFHTYSIPNQWLIVHQCPEATQVAGYRRWEQLGRTVKKGEKAIRIWAPVMVKTNSAVMDDDDPDDLTKAKPVKELRFRLVPVFDIAQTEGADLPAPPARGPLSIENRAQVIADYRDLAGRLAAAGIAVEMPEQDPTTRARGRWYPDRSKIVIYMTPDPARAYATLMHEAAHALAGHGVDYHPDRADAELQAELAAMIAAAAQGYDLSPVAIHYAAGWSSDDPKAVKQQAKNIQALANRLMAFMGLIHAPAAAAA